MKEVSNWHFAHKKHTHAHTQAHTHADTHMHTHSQTHMHTHPNTHTPFPHIANHFLYILVSHICFAATPDTPLGVVCGRGGQVQLLTPLLTGAAHIDFRGKEGLTALHRAAIGGNGQAINVSVKSVCFWISLSSFLFSFALLSFSNFLLVFGPSP